MKKEEMFLLLSEGLSIEEIPNLTNLDELEDLIEKIDFDAATKGKLTGWIKYLKKDTVKHSKSFTEMIRSVAKSKKDEY